MVFSHQVQVMSSAPLPSAAPATSSSSGAAFTSMARYISVPVAGAEDAPLRVVCDTQPESRHAGVGSSVAPCSPVAFLVPCPGGGYQIQRAPTTDAASRARKRPKLPSSTPSSATTPAQQPVAERDCKLQGGKKDAAAVEGVRDG